MLRVAERQPDPWLDLCKTPPLTGPAAPGPWRGRLPGPSWWPVDGVNLEKGSGFFVAATWVWPVGGVDDVTWRNGMASWPVVVAFLTLIRLPIGATPGVQLLNISVHVHTAPAHTPECRAPTGPRPLWCASKFSGRVINESPGSLQSSVGVASWWAVASWWTWPVGDALPVIEGGVCHQLAGSA